MLERVLAIVDRLIALAVDAATLLVLPISLLLFLQWPLRELFQSYSREANDLAQLLFALYVSLAITYATRQRAHLAADALAHRYRAATRERLARAGALAVLVPGRRLCSTRAGPAPMNGSVGASVAMLSRVVQPRLDAEGMSAERGAGLRGEHARRRRAALARADPAWGMR